MLRLRLCCLRATSKGRSVASLGFNFSFTQVTFRNLFHHRTLLAPVTGLLSLQFKVTGIVTGYVKVCLAGLGLLTPFPHSTGTCTEHSPARVLGGAT